jgi:hypothetical protein
MRLCEGSGAGDGIFAMIRDLKTARESGRRRIDGPAGGWLPPERGILPVNHGQHLALPDSEGAQEMGGLVRALERRDQEPQQQQGRQAREQEDPRANRCGSVSSPLVRNTRALNGWGHALPSLDAID